MTYVADTHAFLWYLAEDKRLGSSARQIFDSAERGEATIFVPTIVLAESLHILEKKRVKLQFQDIFRKLAAGTNYTTMPLDFEVVSRMAGFAQELELHDRILVASASLLGAVLITKDEAIRKTGYVQTAW